MIGSSIVKAQENPKMKFELDSEQIRIKLREIFDSQSDFKLKSIRKAGQLYVLGLSSKESVMHPADRLNLLFVNWGENFDLIKLKKTVRSGGFRRREYVPRESHYRGMRNLFATFLFRDGWLAQVPESGEAGEDEKQDDLSQSILCEEVERCEI